MYKYLEDFVGNTPLVRLVRIPGADMDRRGNVILAKLEGNNPAGSVKAGQRARPGGAGGRVAAQHAGAHSVERPPLHPFLPSRCQCGALPA